MEQEIENIAKIKAKTIVCPHCTNPISLAFRTEILEAKIPRQDQAPTPWDAGLSPAQKEMVEYAEKSGALNAFAEIVKQVKHPQVPKDMRRFFLNFIKLMRPNTVPWFVVSHFADELKVQTSEIQFFSCQNIGMVVAKGVIRRFMPFNIAVGTKLKGSGNTSKAWMPANEEVFKDWIRTKFGYVLEGSPLVHEMQKRSKGEFANPIL